MTSIVVAVAAVLVLLIAVLFALHCEYHTGVIGTVGLFLIAASAFSRAGNIVDTWREGSLEAYLTPQAVMLWMGLAMFLCRQAVLFLRRWHAGGASFYSLGRRRRSSAAANDERKAAA